MWTSVSAHTMLNGYQGTDDAIFSKKDNTKPWQYNLYQLLATLVHHKMQCKIGNSIWDKTKDSGSHLKWKWSLLRSPFGDLGTFSQPYRILLDHLESSGMIISSGIIWNDNVDHLKEGLFVEHLNLSFTIISISTSLQKIESIEIVKYKIMFKIVVSVNPGR